MKASNTITKESIDAAGVPRLHHLYAVFDEDDACRRAMDALHALGLESEQLRGTDAPLLEHPALGAGILSRLERVIKGVGGERHLAAIYAHHLREGRTMLAVRLPHSATAAEVAHVITANGGYEVAYFRDWSIEYLSPRENVAHGLPTHSGTNTDE
ncbi:MAG TPA: hypothetical protein VNL35_17635 [Chloroflexota bacterium]|nr:hypothetical protein [Chloroflexota bacterium]